MKLEFDKIDEAVLPNFKGGEKAIAAKMYFDGSVRVMKARLEPGSSIGLHCHDTSSEVMFITGGSGTVIYDGEPIALKAGDVHYCPKGHSHTLINTGSEDLTFSAVVPQQ